MSCMWKYLSNTVLPPVVQTYENFNLLFEFYFIVPHILIRCKACFTQITAQVLEWYKYQFFGNILSFPFLY